MAFYYTTLKNRRFDDVPQRYGESDTLLYALGIGLGADPFDLKQLRFVYEENLLALPTMAVVLGSAGFWMQASDTGLDWQNIVHLDQELTLHRPLQATGEVVGKTVVESLIDKRAQGALLTTRCDLFDRATNELIATSRSGNLCRSNGHFEGDDPAGASVHRLPNRPPDLACVLPSFAQAALIYRLSGDRNPLHADPQQGQRAGFERPILHGLATFGMAGHAALRVLCDYQPARLKKLKARFTAPFYPGETLRTTFWKYGNGSAGFQCHSVEREVMVINHGWVEYSDPKFTVNQAAALVQQA